MRAPRWGSLSSSGLAARRRFGFAEVPIETAADVGPGARHRGRTREFVEAEYLRRAGERVALHIGEREKLPDGLRQLAECLVEDVVYLAGFVDALRAEDLCNAAPLAWTVDPPVEPIFARIEIGVELFGLIGIAVEVFQWLGLGVQAPTRGRRRIARRRDMWAVSWRSPSRFTWARQEQGPCG